LKKNQRVIPKAPPPTRSADYDEYIRLLHNVSKLVRSIPFKVIDVDTSKKPVNSAC